MDVTGLTYGRNWVDLNFDNVDQIVIDSGNNSNSYNSVWWSLDDFTYSKGFAIGETVLTYLDDGEDSITIDGWMLTQNDTDVDGDTLSIDGESVSTSVPDAEATYDVDGDFITLTPPGEYGGEGEVSFVYMVSDGELLSDEVTVNVTFASNSGYLEGGEGNEILLGGSEDDILLGGGGDDILRGYSGDDELVGGAGADIFFFGSGDDDDIIYDFGTADTLLFEGYLANNLTLTDSGQNTIISDGSGGLEVTLYNQAAANLTPINQGTDVSFTTDTDQPTYTV